MMLRSVAARMLRTVVRRPAPPPRLSFGGWEELGREEARVVSLCHPKWRGVRTSAYSHRAPVVEVADAGHFSEELAEGMAGAGVEVLVLHAFPPGSEVLLARAGERGIATRCVLYSSMAQHGGEPGEAALVDRVVGLARAGGIGRLGFAKAGQVEAFRALGLEAAWVPNRPPHLPPLERRPLGEGLQVGVFAEPFWRKNVVTQLGAVALLEGARAHVIWRPRLEYLAGLEVVEHGLLPHQEFLGLQASMDLNLYVTLSECFPLTPVESYLSGVPCLMSPTSSLFRDDPELWELTTVSELDNPAAIARAALRLLDHRQEAVPRAQAWIEAFDQVAADLWAEFVSG